jgi:hypothetical protein
VSQWTATLPEGCAEINLSENQIEYIVAENLPRNLKVLDVSHNQIHELFPQNLQIRLKLQAVFLSHNRLQSLSSLATLDRLTILDVSFNRLRSLEGMNILGSLKILKATGNALRDVDGLIGLKSLEELDISRNPLCPSTDCIRPLSLNKHLSHLNVSETGISELKNLRLLILHLMPQVQILNGANQHRSSTPGSKLTSSSRRQNHQTTYARKGGAAKPALAASYPSPVTRSSNNGGPPPGYFSNLNASMGRSSLEIATPLGQGEAPLRTSSTSPKASSHRRGTFFGLYSSDEAREHKASHQQNQHRQPFVTPSNEEVRPSVRPLLHFLPYISFHTFPSCHPLAGAESPSGSNVPGYFLPSFRHSVLPSLVSFLY